MIRTLKEESNNRDKGEMIDKIQDVSAKINHISTTMHDFLYEKLENIDAKKLKKIIDLLNSAYPILNDEYRKTLEWSKK